MSTKMWNPHSTRKMSEVSQDIRKAGTWDDEREQEGAENERGNPAAVADSLSTDEPPADQRAAEMGTPEDPTSAQTPNAGADEAATNGLAPLEPMIPEPQMKTPVEMEMPIESFGIDCEDCAAISPAQPELRPGETPAPAQPKAEGNSAPQQSPGEGPPAPSKPGAEGPAPREQRPGSEQSPQSPPGKAVQPGKAPQTPPPGRTEPPSR